MTLLLTVSRPLVGDTGNIGDALRSQGQTRSPLFQCRPGTLGTTAFRSFPRPQVPVFQVQYGDIAKLSGCMLVPAVPIVPESGARTAL